MTKPLIETKLIGDWLFEHREQAAPCSSLRNRVSEEDYAVLRAISRMCSRSRGRSNFFDWDHDLTMWQLWDRWQQQKGRCAVTNVKLSTEQGTHHEKNAYAASIDRLDSREGYVIENVRIVTHFYNNMKNTWSDHLVTKMLTEWVKSDPRRFK
jgi:hypothetical protein